MLDALAHISDSELAGMHAEQLLSRPAACLDGPKNNVTHDLFQYDQYDWSGWDGFGTSYVPFKLTRGYFTYVERDRVEEINERFSHAIANVQLYRGTTVIQKIYAIVGGNGHPQQYLHRFLAGVKDGKVKVDHSTGLSLDNRDDVLKRKKHCQNIAHHDSSARRYKNHGLLRGVFPDGDGYRAQIKHNGVTMKSPKCETEEAAHAWYCKKFKEIFKFDFVDLSKRANYPLFPPKIGDKVLLPF